MKTSAILLLSFALALIGSAQTPQPSPATPAVQPSPAPPLASANVDKRWQHFELYEAGSRAYTSNQYKEAYSQFVAFKALNETIFAAPPDDLKIKVADIVRVIDFSRLMANNTFGTTEQIMGGPNSVINNPGQIMGGPNSVINNPVHIFGW